MCRSRVQILPVLPEDATFRLPLWKSAKDAWFRMNYGVYKEWLRKGVQPLRFVEYSISSTLMVLIIALLNGATDLWLLLLLAVANWSTMMFGLYHEQLLRARMDAPDGSTTFLTAVSAHVAGWVPFVAVWAMLLGQFEWTLDAIKGIPAVIKVIPPVLLSMFTLFGVNQVLATVYLRPQGGAGSDGEAPPESAMAVPKAPDGSQPPVPSAMAVVRRQRWSYMHSEVAYTVLSLTAKSLLAWMLLGGTLNQDPSKLVAASLC